MQNYYIETFIYILNLLFILGCVKYYIQKKTVIKKGTKEFDDEVNKTNHFITEEINDTIKKIRKQQGELCCFFISYKATYKVFELFSESSLFFTGIKSTRAKAGKKDNRYDDLEKENNPDEENEEKDIEEQPKELEEQPKELEDEEK